MVYPRTLEILDAHGVAERLIAEGLRARRFTTRDRDRTLITVPFDRLPTAFRLTLLVPQTVTESVLPQRLQEFGTTVLRPYTVSSLTHDGSAVTALFETAERMEAKSLVGAEECTSPFAIGRRLSIDEAAQISRTRWLTCDLRATPTASRKTRSRCISRLKASSHACRFRTAASSWSPMWPRHPSSRMSNSCSAYWTARSPQSQRPRIRDIVWSSRFRIHHDGADRFRAGPVALAGDAAHDNGPHGGQGMNTGIGDAVVLAGALDRAIQHDAPDLARRIRGGTSAGSPASGQVDELADAAGADGPPVARCAQFRDWIGESSRESPLCLATVRIGIPLSGVGPEMSGGCPCGTGC
ncbi:MAG: FAD-dependent monooxygenase [Chloroflexi bacterium]|nr:FAD-dependent monooxygenase [Chloroflexota bacterium]